MKIISLVIFLHVFLQFQSLNAQDQNISIGIISDIDSSFTHLYEARKDHHNQIKKYPFNLNEYIFSEFSRVIDTVNLLFRKNYQVISYPLPDNYRKINGLLNFFGKPNKNTKDYIEELGKEEGLDYAIVISFKALGPESENTHLNPHDYGIASYESYPDLLTYFTLIEFFLLKTGPAEEINFDYPTNLAKDVKYFDFILEEDLTPEERINLPEHHIDFAIKTVMEMAGIKIEKLLRIILQKISQRSTENEQKKIETQ